MKLPLFHRSGVLVIACLLLSTQVAGQRKPNGRDKSQIIRFILQRYDFNHTESCCENAANTIYLLAENISPADVPSRKGLKFIIIERDEIDRLRKKGVEYYEFRPFKTTKTALLVSFVRTFVSPNGANGSVMEYTCRKVGGKWKLKAHLDGVFAS